MKLSDFADKVILLDFFADWCPHCKKMYPAERALVERLKDSDFALLGIHCENQRILRKLTDDKEVTWQSWADGEAGPIAEKWNVNAFPKIIAKRS